MSKKQNITVGIDIEAKVDSAQKSLVTLQKSFAKLNLSDAMQSEFSSLFSSIDKELNKIVQKTASGKISLVDVASVQKSFEKIEGLYATLNKKIAQRGIMKSGLQEDAAALSAITGAVKLYDKAIEGSAKQEEKLNKTLEAEKIKRDELLEKQKLQKTVSEEELLNQKLKLDNAKKLEKAAKKELEQAKKALDAKIAASGGKYTEADITKKGSALRKTDAYKAYKDAAQKYTTASANTNADSAALKGMVTPAMQAAELKKVEEAIESAEIKLQEFNETSAKNNLADALGKAKKALESLEIDFSEYGVDINDIKSIDDLREALEKVKNVSGKKTKKNLQEIAEGVEQLDNACEGANNDVKGAGEALEDLHTKASQSEAFEARIKDFLGLSGAAQLLRSSLRNAMQTITELDATMTEMAVVTDLGVGDYWKQLPEYTARAKELGLAIGDVYKADTLFYQQGLKTNEVVEISTQTMKMAAIAGLDTATATDRMTAALRGFNMELNETSAQKVSDVYSELAAITAADVDEISNAMTKTASIASSAGMEFETTAAFLSQIIETTRESAETAGTAMKTIIARFQELKKAPSEIGEVDGEIVDANKIETALRSVGVALRDSSGQFRELDEVFLELSSKWDGLDKNTQRYIATIAAGSRQQSRFIAMMSDYSRTQELVTAANTSAGASQKQFEKTTESLGYKLNNLKAAWDEFTMGIMNSELLKTGVDILTSLLEIVNKVTGALDGVGGSLTKIMSVVALFNLGKSLFDKFGGPIKNFFLKLTKEAYEAGKNGMGAYAKGQEEYLKQPKGANDGSKNEKKKNLSALGNLKQGNAFGKERKKALEDLKKAEKGTEAYDNLQKKVLESGEKQWEAYGKSVAQAGQLVTGAGLAVSMLGSALKSAGLEAEWLTKLGNWVTVAGGAISALGPVITKIVGKLVAGGKSAMAAWGWVAAVVAAVVALGIAVSGIVTAVKNASPEEKLKKATAAADAAKESADELNESYQNLKTSLNSLDYAQDELENLVVGTDAWCEAVEKVNEQVLELIEQYPELAKYVEHKNGVMSIDMDDSGVQAALENAKKKAANADIVATGAQLNVLEAQNDVLYDSLSKKAKIAYEDPETAAALAAGSTYAVNVGSAAGAGALIGNAIPIPGIGAGIGAGIAALGAAIVTAVTGEADMFAEMAAKDAEAKNDKTQSTVEGIARALASGKIYDTGSGYEVAEGITDYELLDLGIKREEINDFYDQLGDSTDELKKFGKELNATKEQSDAYFDTMAIQIFNTLDKSAWGGEDSATTKIADNVLGGESLQARRDNISKELEDTDFLDKNLDNDKEQRLTSAIQKTYGADAKLQEGENGYEIVDGAGNIKLSNVTSDQLRNIVATQEAKAEVEEASEVMPKVTGELMRSFGEKLGNNPLLTEDAIVALLDNEKGLGLTEEQQKMFANLSEEELKEIYNSSDILKTAFADSAIFVEKIQKPVASAGDAFKQSAKTFNKISKTAAGQKLTDSLSKLTGQQQFGLASEEKMGAVYSKGTADEIAAFEEAMAVAMSQENADKIAEFLSADNLDWSDQDQLMGAKRKLIEQYGLEEAAANNLVMSISDAVNAVSDLTVLDDVFGEFYQTTQKINAAMKKLNDLQWDYERLLVKGANTQELVKNQEEQRQQLMDTAYDALDNYNKALEDMARGYAEGVNWDGLGIDLTQYVKFDPNTGRYDTSGLAELMQEEEYRADKDNGKKIQDYIKYLDSLCDRADDQIKIAKDSYVQLEKMNEASEESYWELWDVIEQATFDKLISAIELEEAILDATKDGNDELVSKLQEQINVDRKNRENDKTEKSISEMRSKLAYLGMDSSGANALEMLDLQKTIEETQESYQDSLVDQSIQQLQDANEKAYQQRERQIALQELQLKEYRYGAEYQSTVTKKLDEFMGQVTSGIPITETNVWSELKEKDKYKEIVNPGEKYNYWEKMTQTTANAGPYWMSKMEAAANNTAGVTEGSMAQLLKDIADNTSIGKLQEQMQLGQLASADTLESEWGARANGGFAPNIISSRPQDYESEEAIGEAIAIGNMAYTKTNQDMLNESDSRGASVHKEFTYYPYIGQDSTQVVTEQNGEMVSETADLLSREDFYTAVNSGKTVKFNGTEFTDELLTNSLAYKTKTKIGENDYLVGSYEHYMALANQYYKEPIEGGTSTWDAAMKYEEAMLKYKASQQMSKLINSGEFTGIGDMLDSNDFSSIMEAWRRIGKNRDELGAILANSLSVDDLIGYVPEASVNDGWFGHIAITGLGNDAATKGQAVKNATVPEKVQGFLSKQGDNKPFLYKGEVYWKDREKQQSPFAANWYYKDVYYRLKNTSEDTGGGAANILANYIDSLKKYKTGGLADFTGPAWLDGTPSKPEYILNSAQTERFFSLVDVLERFDSDAKSKKPSGDNYFDIEINVEKLENDYDVEQVADKIRRMIYDDAAYRNVNTINHIR